MKLTKILLTALAWTLITYLSLCIESGEANINNFDNNQLKILIFLGWLPGMVIGMFRYLED